MDKDDLWKYVTKRETRGENCTALRKPNLVRSVYGMWFVTPIHIPNVAPQRIRRQEEHANGYFDYPFAICCLQSPPETKFSRFCLFREKVQNGFCKFEGLKIKNV